MKFYIVAKKYGSRAAVGSASILASGLALADDSTGDAASMLTGVSTAGIIAGVVAILTVGIGVRLAMKGQSLGKQSVNRI